jgi:hypothetical protein
MTCSWQCRLASGQHAVLEDRTIEAGHQDLVVRVVTAAAIVVPSTRVGWYRHGAANHSGSVSLLAVQVCTVHYGSAPKGWMTARRAGGTARFTSDL